MRSLIRFFLIFTLGTASFAFAADNVLFTPSYQVSSLKTSDTKELVWGPTFKSVTQITFDHEALRASAMSSSRTALAQPQANPTVSFIVGFNTHTAILDHIEDRGDGNFSWFGRVEGSQFLSHFAAINGSVAGDIWGPNGLHRSIIPRAGQTFLVEWNDAEIGRFLNDDQVLPDLDPDHDSVSRSRRGMESLLSLRLHSPVSVGSFPSQIQPIRRGCPAGQELVNELNLVGAYDTTTAESWTEVEIQVMVQVRVDYLNQTIINTKTGGRYHINLVAVVAIDYTSAVATGGTLPNDLSWVAASSEIATLKQKYNAQVVSLFVGKTDGKYGGYGIIGGTNALSVVAIENASLVLAHEVGHNFGMNHQWNTPNLNPSPMYAADNQVDNHFTGAVSAWSATLCPSGRCPFIPIYPNPDVLFEGTPTGISGIAENWRMVATGFQTLGATSVCVAK